MTTAEMLRAEGRAEGEARGKAEGATEERRRIAREMLTAGVDIETTARVTHMDVEEIEQLSRE